MKPTAEHIALADAFIGPHGARRYPDVGMVAQLLAIREHAARESAWDEGNQATGPHASNPYRKEPKDG